MTAILEFADVAKTFSVGSRKVRALRGVTLSVEEGTCHAIVGESGSGKSTLANIILGIYPQSSGHLKLRGQELSGTRPLALKREIQLVQQNPSSALNPRRSVGASLRLALDVHNIGDRASRNARVAALLTEVGLVPEMASRVPGALSGGQKQRVAIARALACEPRIIVLDEPTSALDVLVQAQVLTLLNKLRVDRGLTYIFITHDLAVVRNVADFVSVFKTGEIVEAGDIEQIFTTPSQAYTRELICAVPVVSEEELAMRETLRQEMEPI